VTPASDGSFTVDLAAYASTNPKTAYKLRVEWFDTGGNYLTTEEIPWAIVVSGDGALTDMFADVQAGKLLVKGDKGDAGNVVQQAAIDALTAKNTEQDGRLTTNEAKNAQQDSRLTGAEIKNTAQDGRLDAVEAKNTAQDTAITAARTGATADAKTYTDAEVLKDRNRLTPIESKNTAQDGRLDGVEAKNVAQDGRLDAVEAKQSVKCVRLESGVWVWDTVAGTHFVIPDHTGALIVRATAQPVPAATPALNW
jgi:hypothetical protein